MRVDQGDKGDGGTSHVDVVVDVVVGCTPAHFGNGGCSLYYHFRFHFHFLPGIHWCYCDSPKWRSSRAWEFVDNLDFGRGKGKVKIDLDLHLHLRLQPLLVRSEA